MSKVKYYIYRFKFVYKNEGLKGVIKRLYHPKLLKKRPSAPEILRENFSEIAMPIFRKETIGNTSVVYTIVSKNYMHYALTVRESFLEKNSTSDFVIFLMDKLMTDDEVKVFNGLIDNNVKIIGFDEVSNNVRKTYFNEMQFKFTVLEMNTGLKPFAMEYLMNSGYEKVMYIDPDIMFYRSIDRILKALDDNDILLTPHILEPYGDEKRPTEIDIMMAGTYNLGFLAIKNTKNTLKMVQWWQERLYLYGFSDIKNGMFTDQKWMDLIPSLYEDVCVFKDPGHNVAYWNMHERVVEKKNGEWVVNSEPLVFFHFSGLPLHDLSIVSKHQDRHNLESFPELKPLFEHYSNSVKSFGPESFGKMKYYFDYIGGSNIQIEDCLRKDYEKVFSLTSRPMIPDDENIKSLLKYFFYEEEGFSRHMKLLYEAREDLQSAFPSIEQSEESKKGFINWYEFDPTNIKAQYSEELQFGVNIIGYFDNIIGVAQVARGFCKLSLGGSIPISVDVIESSAHARVSEYEQGFYSKYRCENSKLENNFIFINADVVEDYQKHYPSKLEGKKNFGIWWWEFEDYFPHITAFDVVDELVVFTDFVGTALKKVAPLGMKVNKMPYPFIQDWGDLEDTKNVKNKYGLQSNDFCFMFSFDFLSSYERKNPEAILYAFKMAFEASDQNIKLIFKTNNYESGEMEYRQFVNLVEDLNLTEQVVLVNESLERGEMISLINASDVYISLHRSEGLGLGMLEAMSLGLPVIATGYGGNMEFMTSDNSCLITYEMVEVKEDFGPYQKGWKWAEPDTNQAADFMSKLYKDKAYRSEVASNAASSIATQYNSHNFTMSLYSIIRAGD